MENSELEVQLIQDMASFSKDPYGFVMYSFEWGKGELAKFDGPDEWAKELFQEISIKLQNGDMSVQDAVNKVILAAISSGHGIGKSCAVAWIILWALATFEDTKGVVTANTETQLRTKTWPELQKWYNRFIAKHWFKCTATALYSVDPAHEKTWRVDAIPWSDSNTEAFAGLHNQGKRVLLIFDEASAISDKVWEVAEGALTDRDTEIFWFAFGNPTRNVGRFRECFRKYRHRWFNKQVDSRTVKVTNNEQLKKWEEDYGVDSDFFKVRVRGEFPSASDRQFIPASFVDSARGRHVNESAYSFAPKIITCDPAWTGSDEIIIGMRQGLAYRQLMSLRKNDDDGIIAGYIAKFEDEHQADAVFIDQGYGTGIYSFGKQMGRRWTLVAFAGESADLGFLNKRAEMWNLMKKWLQEGGCIPDDPQLAEELCGPEYVVKENGKIKLESKEDMKSRGVPSPNRADALALSFAFPVIKKNRSIIQAKRREYDPFS